MPSQDLVSFIVPFYNAEQYISKCVDCILQQTYPHWELLLIDDGSKDQSASISDQCATIDNRIRVIHQENKGVSAARNIGLAQAKGKWITFLDVDDYLSPEWLLEHVNFEEDLVISGFRWFGIKDNDIILEKKKINIQYQLKNEWQNNIVSSPIWYCWGKLFKTSIIRTYNICFPVNIKYSEDFCFVLNYLLYTSEYITTNSIGYNHLITNNRSNKFSLDTEEVICHIKTLDKYLSLLENRSDSQYNKIRDALYNRFIILYLNHLQKSQGIFDYNHKIKKFNQEINIYNYATFETFKLPRRCIYFVIFKYVTIGYFIVRIFGKKFHL